jgi:hypothetical protein
MNASPGFFNGVRVFQSPLALNYRCWFEVERLPIKKRRRGYRVRKHEESTPGCWGLADGSFVMHPALLAKLKAAA